MELEEILARLEAEGSPRNVAGMARFGITGDEPYGVSIPFLRKLAKEAGRDHGLAAALWESGRHEARILSALVDEPAMVTRVQMDRQAKEFRSWDVCDAFCMNLYDRTPHADAMIRKWATAKPEFVKRAAFATMAALAVHDKRAPDARFLAFLPLIERASDDDRNYVRKGVNWALRSIGKRNPALSRAAIATAKRIRAQDTRSARWIAADALRELEARRA